MTTKDELEGILDRAIQDLEWIFPTVPGSPYIDRAKQVKIKSEALNALANLISIKQKEVLEQAHKCVDDTVMFLTKDLPSLLNSDHNFNIRYNHKQEIHKNLDKLAETLNTSKKDKK